MYCITTCSCSKPSYFKRIYEWHLILLMKVPRGWDGGIVGRDGQASLIICLSSSTGFWLAVFAIHWSITCHYLDYSCHYAQHRSQPHSDLADLSDENGSSPRKLFFTDALRLYVYIWAWVCGKLLERVFWQTGTSCRSITHLFTCRPRVSPIMRTQPFRRYTLLKLIRRDRLYLYRIQAGKVRCQFINWFI